jgi:hypothetical protein
MVSKEEGKTVQYEFCGPWQSAVAVPGIFEILNTQACFILIKPFHLLLTLKKIVKTSSFFHLK